MNRGPDATGTPEGLKHLHCWLMQRHRERRPGGDDRAKYCTKCCWCEQERDPSKAYRGTGAEEETIGY